MDLPTNYIEKYRPRQRKTGEPRSEWELQIDAFLQQLNPGREADGYKPYTHSRLARLLSQKGINDAGSAYVFYQQCAKGHSFSRLFSYLIKQA
jgi:hypothetical protein